MNGQDNKDIRYVASCSFGKDSIAAILVRLQDGEPVDEVLYSELWFDENTPAEIPEHHRWIHEVAIPKLEADYGLKTTIVRAETNFVEQFYRVTQSGRNEGIMWGFPLRNFPWCNSELKVRPMRRHVKHLGSIVEIIGYAYDEMRRARKKLNDERYIFPLIERRITEAQAFDIAEQAGLLSPAYNNGRTRLGCFFCTNQSINELRRLRVEFPELWSRLLELDKISPRPFRGDYKTVADLEHNFELEDRQIDFIGETK